MSKKYNILLTFFCILLSNCMIYTPKGLAHTINPPITSFVKVITNTEFKECVNKECKVMSTYHTGSGIAINILKNVRTVMTAGHVCDSGIKESLNTTIKVLDHEGTLHASWPVLISQYNQKNTADLCVLYVPSLSLKRVNFSTSPPRVGEDVYYIGSPLGIYHPPTVPILKGVFSGDINEGSSMATVPVIGGASGSGVFNSKDEIVGIIFATNPLFHHVSLMSNHATFIKFVKAAKKRLQKINNIAQ